MTHELAGALQQAGRIRERCAVKKPHVYVRDEYIDVAEGRIPQTCNRTAVMQKLPDLVPAFSHQFEPVARDISPFACMAVKPGINGRVALDRSVEPKYPGLHRRFTLHQTGRLSGITQRRKDL